MNLPRSSQRFQPHIIYIMLQEEAFFHWGNHISKYIVFDWRNMFFARITSEICDKNSNLLRILSWFDGFYAKAKSRSEPEQQDV